MQKHLYILLLLPLLSLPAKEQFFDKLHDAARRGDAASQLKLADEFFFGRGRPGNPALAVYWYRKAAEQGNPGAQYNLGACFEFGWGCR